MDEEDTILSERCQKNLQHSNSKTQSGTVVHQGWAGEWRDVSMMQFHFLMV